jgi:hypothetical protein
MKRKITSIVVPLLLLVFANSAAVANPLFSIGEGGTQTCPQGIDTGNVVPVTPGGLFQPGSGLSYAAEQFYSSQNGGNFIQSVATLRPDIFISDGSESHLSLVMSWDPSETDLGVVTWDYVYDADPDLTNTMVHFSLYPPPGVWDFSLELIDAAGRSRGWFASGPAPAWASHWIRPDVAAVQGPFTHFFDQPGFDITTVVAIRLDEAGMLSSPFPVDPALNGVAWNAWNHLSVTAVPEPSTFTLSLLALTSFGMHRLRRRR